MKESRRGGWRKGKKDEGEREEGGRGRGGAESSRLRVALYAARG